MAAASTFSSATAPCSCPFMARSRSAGQRAPRRSQAVDDPFGDGLRRCGQGAEQQQFDQLVVGERPAPAFRKRSRRTRPVPGMGRGGALSAGALVLSRHRAVLSRPAGDGEDLAAVLGDADRVLELRRRRRIAGHRPAVGQQLHLQRPVALIIGSMVKIMPGFSARPHRGGRSARCWGSWKTRPMPGRRNRAPPKARRLGVVLDRRANALQRRAGLQLRDAGISDS